MAELIWSPKATVDLEEICDYISKDSEHYAKLFSQRVIALVESIAQFPQAGRIVPEYQQNDIRERILQNYRIVYRAKPETVEIVAIVHGAKLLPDFNNSM